MKLQARFAIILGLIASVALVCIALLIRTDIDRLIKLEIESQLANHLKLNNTYIDDVLKKVSSDLDSLSHNLLTQQFYGFGSQYAEAIFHYELTKVMARYQKHSKLYDEISLLDANGKILVILQHDDHNQSDHHSFLASRIQSTPSHEDQSEYLIESISEKHHHLIAYQPIFLESRPPSHGNIAPVGFIKISLNLESLVYESSANNILSAFEFNAHMIYAKELARTMQIEYREHWSKNSAVQSLKYKDLFTIHAILDKQLFAERSDKVFYESLAMMVLTVVSLILVTMILLKLIIIRQLNTFADLVQSTELSAPSNKRLEAYEKNEFGHLKHQFDSMLMRLKQSSDELKRQAYTDTLTGLPNRAALYHLLNIHTQHPSRPFSIMFLDLDGFKQVNDVYGHDTGDLLLVEVALKLTHIVRGEDTMSLDFLDERHDMVIRLGGDEFTILVRANNNAALIADRIIQLFQNGIRVDDNILYTGASIGIAEFPSDSSDPTLLIQYADLAMYKAKASGKMRYKTFNHGIALEEQRRQRIEQTVREGMEYNRFDTHFQAKVNSKTKKIFGFEALARLRDLEGNLVPPSTFIKIAQEKGVLEYITYIVVEHSCRVLQRISDPTLVASVNISPNQLTDTRLLADIRSIMWRYQINPWQIEFELTEEELVTNFQAARSSLTLLRRFGFRTALDDFGSGYSSLGQLKKFQFDTLKLDRLFVSTDDFNTEAAVGVLNSIKSLADQLKMNIVAEGIETQEQLDFVNQFGIYDIQGYFFSRPIPETQFIEFYHKADT